MIDKGSTFWVSDQLKWINLGKQITGGVLQKHILKNSQSSESLF